MGYDVYAIGVVQETRQRSWNFHLATLEGLCIWFFAYSRLDSVQKIPSHIAQMYYFKATHPQVWNKMEQGGLVIKKLSVLTRQNIRHHKTILKLLLRYCLGTPNPRNWEDVGHDVKKQNSPTLPHKQYKYPSRKICIPAKNGFEKLLHIFVV